MVGHAHARSAIEADKGHQRRRARHVAVGSKSVVWPRRLIYRGPRSAKADSCTAANLPSLTVDRFLEHHVLMTSYSEMPSSFAFIRSTERRFGRNALSQI